MSRALDLFSVAAIGAGAFFFFAGTVGLLRFSDSLTRLHALTKPTISVLASSSSDYCLKQRKPARRAQADRDLGAHPIIQRVDRAAHRARPAPPRRLSECPSSPRYRSCDPRSGGRWLVHRRE